MSPAATRVVSRSTTTSVTPVQVRVTVGPQKGLEVALSDRPLLVGTAEDAQLRLMDDTVSQRHCELWAHADGVRVRDLGSTNGIYLEGVRLFDAIVPAGSKLRVGESTLVLKAEKPRTISLSARDSFGSLVGASSLMRALYVELEQVAASDAALLIEGETGAGKDVAARAVHATSPRQEGPLVVFDCGAVQGTLLESELFGHEKGAFTGAASARAGAAELAHGGVLVLDEVGELPAALQPKLLRLVEQHEARRIGAGEPIKVDVRIIACTHRKLAQEVKAGRFRQDLFHRLGALRVRVPALRERPEDVELLVDAFLKERGSPRHFAELSAWDQELFRAHRWSGNVRELRNVVERLILFPDAPAGKLIDPESTTDAEGRFLSLPEARERNTDAFERRYVQLVLARAEGVVTDAAKLAGVSRQFLSRLLSKHGLGKG